MNNRANILVMSLLLLAFIIWSNAFIAIGLLREKVSAVELLVIRFAPVGLISAGLTALFFRGEFIDLVKNHLWRLLAMGLLSVTGYNLFLNLGQTYINPNAASLLITMNPLLTLLLAVQFLGEPLTGKRALGTSLAFAGLVVVVALGKVGVTESVLIPLNKVPYAILTVLAPTCWAAYTIIAKPLTTKYSPAGLNFSILTVGSLPVFLGLTPRLVAKTLALPALDLFALAFLIVGCTIIAFYLWLIGVRQLKASNVSLFVFLNPPLTAAFSYLYYGQQISGWFFVGGSVMLIGIGLAVASDVRRSFQATTRHGGIG